MFLEDRVSVVTGAGSGIGKAIALRLGKEGSAVVVADIDEGKATSTAGEIEAMSRTALPIQVDVTKAEDVRRMVESAVARFGRIDVLVNAAGVIRTQLLLDVEPEDYDRIFDVNMRGLFFCLQSVAKEMAKGSGGRIVNIASVSARGPRPLQAVYAASKAAVISLTWSAAAALAKHGILVNAVCPGVVETPMWQQIDREMGELFGYAPGEARQRKLADIPLGRVEKPEDVANAVAFLVSPEASYITGQALNVCGGLEMN